MGTAMTRMVREEKIGKYEDATRGLWIVVTEIDTVRGQRFAPDACVLAKATCRAVPNALKAFFYKYGAYVAKYDVKTKKHKTYRYMPSAEARRAIEIYDETGKFPPGRYRLDAPTGSHSLKAIEERGEKRLGRRHLPGNGTIKRSVAVATSSQGRTSSPKSKRASKRGRLEYVFAY
jgi:hypothetical protein